VDRGQRLCLWSVQGVGWLPSSHLTDKLSKNICLWASRTLNLEHAKSSTYRGCGNEVFGQAAIPGENLGNPHPVENATFREDVPARPVDATPYNQMLLQYFPSRINLYGDTQSEPNQGY